MRRSLSAAVVLAAALVPFAPARAQTAPDTTLLASVAAGPRGLAPNVYLRQLLEARRLQDAGSHGEAAAILARLAAAYPLSGEVWTRLGRTRAAAGDTAGAAAAFERAYALGAGAQGELYAGFAQITAYTAAQLHAALGRPDSALAWLRRAVTDERAEFRGAILADRGFASLRADPRFRALAGAPPADTSRAAGWRSDLAYLLDEIRRVHPIYSRAPLPDSITAAAGQLAAAIPTLGDAEVYVGLQRLLAMFGHGHNGLWTVGSTPRLRLTHLPLRLYVFPEGIFVVDADSAHADLVGARVTAFDATPAERALAATARMIDAENPANVLWLGPYDLESPQFLHALGIAAREDGVRLTVRDLQGRVTTRWVGATPLPEVGPGGSRKLTAPPLPSAAATPLWLREPGVAFAVVPLAEPGAWYLRFNQVADQRAETLEHFGLRLRAELRANPGVHALVVDLRRNNGGNTYLYTELLRTLVAFSAGEGNRVYALVGRGTYSAAQNFATELGRLAGATFVGEPTGSKPVAFGDPVSGPLPYSGANGGPSTVVWQLTSPRDTRLWIAPDLPVALTAADYFAGRDPVLDAVRADISARADTADGS